MVGVFENCVVTKNTFKAPESCSRRSDSLEWSKVEKARKNRGGLGRAPPSLPLSLSPLPSPTLFFFFFFFAPIYISRRFQLPERPEHANNSPSALLSSCHFQWSTQVTY